MVFIGRISNLSCKSTDFCDMSSETFVEYKDNKEIIPYESKELNI